jgi:hypothetical protein
MENERLQQLFKALNPLSCAQVRERLSDWALGPFEEAGAEQAEAIEPFTPEEDEAMREHVLVCDACLLAFSEAVGRHIDAGVIERQPWPRDLPLPSLALYTAYAAFQRAQEVLGMLWEPVQQAAREGQQWAMEQLTEGRRLLEGTMALLPRRRAMAGALGWLGAALGDVQDTESPVISAEVVDEHFHPQDRMLPLAIRTEEAGPLITADGCFAMTLHTNEAQWQGAPALCTLLLVEGQRVSFAGVVEPDPHGPGGQVHFAAEGLPVTETSPVPLGLIEIRLVVPSSEAPR